MELLLICAVLGCIPAAIASSKGRSFGAWWIYGALLFIVALIHSLCIKRDHKAIEKEQLSEGLVKCPYCAEMVKPEAIKCKHCGSDLQPLPTKSALVPIAKIEVTRNLADSVILDDFKVSDICTRMRIGNERKSVQELLDEYSGELTAIKDRIPESLHNKFDESLINHLNK
ncbi:zinc ribbon domain-containing protein [Tatumella sp. UCD-D_suzukii]|uniref:zinc ribbon domain-containing protein n=1 Tax=Tatumella sp. UCD-D_suzukii TaxID=1408192 RepID=UPI00046ECBAD|nr:zinc ribbon domain-containing protein [Tatumella sp. UCD-D_suzukii]